MLNPFNPILVWFYHTALFMGWSTVCLLSIPFWSDFIRKDSWNALGQLSALNFQSHFGLILSRAIMIEYEKRDETFNPILVWFYLFPDLPSTALKDTFNPILVWFYQKHGLKIPERSGCLSIPFWSDFIIFLAFPTKALMAAFNPILVWFYLYAFTLISYFSFILAFNPILVWFYR